MSNWKTYKIGDLVTMGILERPTDGNHGEIHPKGSDFLPEGIPFIMATDIKNGQIDFVNCKRISKQQANNLRKGFAIEGDVLLTHKASLGRTTIVPKLTSDYIMLTPQVTYYRIKDPKRLSNSFLYHYFNSKNFQTVLDIFGGGGSTRAYIGITEQLNLPISCPDDLPTQTRIANILSSLDDKIELNRQMNQTLEQMAQALFKKYFVDDEGLKLDMSLLEFADLLTGGTPQTSVKEYWDGHIHWLSAKDVTPNSGGFIIETERKITEKGIKESHAKLLPAYATVITARGTVGKYCLIPSPMAISQSNYALKAKGRDAAFVLFRIVAAKIEEMQRNSYGTVFDTITTQTLRNITISVPSDEVIENLERLLKPIYIKILESEYENQHLAKIRDTLLPKLMNGEIEINNPVADEILS